MAEYTIDKIEYDSNVYKLQDNISGYTTNTGTVTSVASGTGLTGGPVSSSGTIKANLNSESSLGTIGTTDKLYAVGVDSNGQLCVNVPWSGASYTATSPIDITSGVISHEASGVTAGTYDGGLMKTIGIYIPSVTVDAKGHITSATDLGLLIPNIVNNSSYSDENPGIIPGYSWSSALRSSVSLYSTYSLAAGNTTTTITVSSDSNSCYPHKTYFRVADIQAIDATTHEPVVVDWSTSAILSGGGSIIITVSIAEAYTHNIYLYPVLTYCYSK